MSETEPKEVLPQRTITLSQGVLYGVGCGIGGSIFVLLGLGIDEAGSAIFFRINYFLIKVSYYHKNIQLRFLQMKDTTNN